MPLQQICMQRPHKISQVPAATQHLQRLEDLHKGSACPLTGLWRCQQLMLPPRASTQGLPLMVGDRELSLPSSRTRIWSAGELGLNS